MPEIAKLAVLISGTGRTLQNIAEKCQKGDLPAKIVTVISSSPLAPGIERARRFSLPTFVVDREKYKNSDEFSAEITRILGEYSPDLICLAGFVHLYKFPEKYNRRVLNIHPALLPKFGGKGMYGDRVHKAVLAAGEKESGCTVHFCDLEYDHGEIILQKKVPVYPNDTVQTLAARVFEAEIYAYPEALRMVIDSMQTKRDGTHVPHKPR